MWLAFLTDGFTPFSGGIGSLPGLALLVLAAGRIGLAPTPAWLATLGLNLAASITIILAFSFVWGSFAFWAPRAAEEINSASFAMIDQLKPFPLDTVGAGLTAGLLTIVPAGFVAWYPSRALLGLDSSPAGPWITPAAALGFGIIAWLVFREGLRHYGHTGSQRYHDMGHRR
jgi:ABC-2 type transport system permease protein